MWEGHVPGIYYSWEETLKQIKNYPGARHKSFSSLEEAKEALSGNPEEFMDYGHSKYQTPSRIALGSIKEIIKDSICVDAACSGNPGIMEYRGVETFTGKELFHVGPLEEGTNNIGEFLAIVHALALFERQKNIKTVIYTDSKTAMAWVKNRNAKTKLQRTSRNSKLFQYLERAVMWLHNYTHRNPIIKWKTEEWGEIPADFGRK